MLVLDRSPHAFIEDRRDALAKNLVNGLGDFTRGVRESDDEQLGPDQWKVYAWVVQLRLAVEASQPETARRVAEDARRLYRKPQSLTNSAAQARRLDELGAAAAAMPPSRPDAPLDEEPVVEACCDVAKRGDDAAKLKDDAAKPKGDAAKPKGSLGAVGPQGDEVCALETELAPAGDENVALRVENDFLKLDLARARASELSWHGKCDQTAAHLKAAEDAAARGAAELNNALHLTAKHDVERAAAGAGKERFNVAST